LTLTLGLLLGNLPILAAGLTAGDKRVMGPN